MEIPICHIAWNVKPWGMYSMKASFENAVKSLVSDEEVEAAAAALAWSMGRLWGAGKPADKADLRDHARAALHAAAWVRISGVK
jgi:hypothetical protein